MTGQPLATFAKMTPFIIIRKSVADHKTRCAVRRHDVYMIISALGVSYYLFLLTSWRQTDVAAHVGERIAKVLQDVGGTSTKHSHNCCLYLHTQRVSIKELIAKVRAYKESRGFAIR